MQQLELFPELNDHIGVEFTDGEDVYISKTLILECKGCAFEFEYYSSDSNCYKSGAVLDCVQPSIIWVKKG